MSAPHRTGLAQRLFFGEIPEEQVFPYPRLLHSEQAAVRRLLRALRDLAPAFDARKSDEVGRLPVEVTAGLRDLGLYGLSTPAAYGGLGLPFTAACRVYQELADLDASAAVDLLFHDTLGARAILLFGTEDQRRRYLPDLCAGARRCAFAQAEAHSGSDAASIRTRATPATLPPEREGGHGRLGYVLNGTKIWVTGGAQADLFTVFAQTEVHRDGARVDRITGFLVERGPGVRTGAEEPKLGLRGCSTTALFLDEVRLPREAVLGAIGGGFKVSMETMSSGRLALGAVCVGIARQVLARALLHATTRRQFSRLLSSFGMIKDKLAQMQIDLYAAESMLYLTCGLIDREARRHPPLTHGRSAVHDAQNDPASDYALESACCKVFASEMLFRVTGEAMGLSAGAGFMGDYPFERHLRDSRFFLTVLSTSEILRCYIALTGMQGPGEHLAKLATAIKHPLRGYGLVMDTLIDQVRVAAYGGPALTLHHPRLKKEAVSIEDTVEALQKGVDRALRRHGKQISEMQYVQRRVADVTIDLYAMIACVSRTSAALRAHDARQAAGEGVEAAGEIDAADRELRLCHGFCVKAAARIRKTLERFNENDDELMKAIAEDSYHGKAYPFDAVLG